MVDYINAPKETYTNYDDLEEYRLKLTPKQRYNWINKLPVVNKLN